MTHRQGSGPTSGHAAIGHGRDEKDDSGREAQEVQAIERLTDDRSGQMARGKKAGRKSDGDFDKGEEDDSADPDYER